MPTSTELLTPQVQVDGVDLPPDAQLIEIRIDQALQVPTRCELRFLDPEYAHAAGTKFKLGAVIVVKWDDTKLATVEVTGMSVQQLPNEPPEFVVVAHDASHRMARGSKVDTYQKMTYSDIVRQVVQANGLTSDVDSTSQVFDYTMQLDSDLSFVTELANRIGYDWWVDENKTFKFKKPAAGALTSFEPGELYSFSVKVSGHRPDAVQVIGWDHLQQQTVKSEASKVTEAALLPSSTMADKVDKTPFGSKTMISGRLAAETVDEANALSDSLQTKWASSAVIAKGVASGQPKVRPGASVKVENFGPLSGTYHVTEAEHIFNAGGYTTRFTAGDRTPTTLVDVLANGHDRMAGTVDHPALAVGVVTSINDPDGKNRVRLKFPGLSADNESAWARVVSLGGGAKRGMVFIPEVGDEVLVGFENGDLRQPVVLGGLYSEKSAVPTWDIANGKVTTRRIASRLGHYIELGDGDGETAQHLLLMLAGGNKLRLGADRFDIELASGKPLTIKIGNSKIDIANNGDMTLEAPNINLKAKLKVNIEASAVDIQGKSQINVAANGKTAISGAQVSVDATAVATIKGNAGVQIN